MKVKVNSSTPINWSNVVVDATLPKKLEKLQELAYNLWWVWNKEVTDLFNEIDSVLWEQCGKNPVLLLEMVTFERLEELSKDNDFLARLGDTYKRFRSYMEEPRDKKKPSVAYFSMEYGLTDVIKIYSGGLGVLAGDYLKEASDSNVDMTAVGFLYREGYFTQQLSMDGQQIAIYDKQNFNKLPLKPVKNKNGEQMVLAVDYPGYKVYCNIWKIAVGRVDLYLFDTDNEKNSQFDKTITAQLYGGDWENRLKQEYLLGVGGIQLLNALGIKKQVYHCNEGHAALINAQRLVDCMQEHDMDFAHALEIIRASGLYTVHTPVPAGHDYFEEGLFAKYMSSFPIKLGISWDDFIGLGRQNPSDKKEKFSMSVFALNTCQEANGVSWLHGKVSQKMFSPIWQGYYPQELHVGYVTNGVHMPTWTASAWQNLYVKTFGEGIYKDQSNEKLWSKIYDVDDAEIWNTHQGLKNKLVDYIKTKYEERWLKEQVDPSRVVSVLNRIDANSMIIGFGRRFATYKRAYLLFTDLKRLSKIVNNPNYPVQFVFTGKAHPADGAGQGLIKRIIEISKMPEFQGKIIFLENYDMALSKRLVSGVDIWLNTPTRPLEASGTSGEKAEMNGVLNFSILDGWWLEGYVRGAGWAITERRTYDVQEYQDKLDAVTIYSKLEKEIIPLYYSKNSKGYSPEWVGYMKNSIAKIAPRFTTKRMIDDYIRKFYTTLAKRSDSLKANDYEMVDEIVEYKNRIAEMWDKITVLEKKLPEAFLNDPKVGDKYNFKIKLGNVESEKGIGVEFVILKTTADKEDFVETIPMKKEECEDGTMEYSLDYVLNNAGEFTYSFRMFPDNKNLAHRMDLCYVKWI